MRKGALAASENPRARSITSPSNCREQAISPTTRKKQPGGTERYGSVIRSHRLFSDAVCAKVSNFDEEAGNCVLQDIPDIEFRDVKNYSLGFEWTTGDDHLR
jgi:hypothetical protein